MPSYAPFAGFQQYQQHVDFIRKWIFPGGFLASFTFMTEAATMGSNSQLVIDEGPFFSLSSPLSSSQDVTDPVRAPPSHEHRSSLRSNTSHMASSIPSCLRPRRHQASVAFRAPRDGRSRARGLSAEVGLLLRAFLSPFQLST
jgi:hypothetical protein